ncbi:MAG: ABC transporter permease [Bacillota bacterium]
MNYQCFNIFSLTKNLWQHKNLIGQLAKREILARYKGSYLGFFWSFLTPFFMLAIYTFVFSIIFEARWGMATGGKVEFAMILFCGLIVFNIFSESVIKAPGLIYSNVSYVKKVVFPLEILPVTVIISSLFNGAVSLFVLLFVLIILMGTFHWTVLFIPIIILPLVMITLGICWFLASLGVFVRDIGHIVGVAVTGLLFLSPIFYPISAIPSEIQKLFYVNPITYIVEDARRVIIWGQQPNWPILGIELAAGILIMILGYAWFQKTREGFADVL